MLDVLLRDAAALPLPALRELADIAAADHRYADRAAAVRLEVVRAELAAATAGGAAPADRVDRLPPGWDGTHDAAARDLVVRALRSVTGTRFEAVLRVAGRFAVEGPIRAVEAEVAAFVTDWLANPGRPYDPGRWPDGGRFADLLCDRLTRQVADNPARTREVASR